MKVTAKSRSHIGDRSHNEDRPHIGENLFAVVDGMGGHAHGAAAAEVAVKGLGKAESPESDSLADALTELTAEGGAPSQLKVLLNQIHQDVVALGRQPEMYGTGACIVVAQIDGDQIHIGWAGDCRAYLLRGGDLSLLTTDHNLYESVKAHRGLEAALEMHRYYASRILVCLGGGDSNPIDPGVRSFTMQKGDLYLLCSDGVHGQMADRQLLGCLQGENPCMALEAEALFHARSDNITSVVLTVSG